MQDIVTSHYNLPDNIYDLSKFVLVGREKLVAVRAEIRAIDKVGLAQEVREQKLHEAQDISEAVLDAETRIGELMLRVPKKQGARTDIKPTDSDVGKYDVIREAGFTPKQVERFQTLAAHPEIVEQTKAEARENDDIVSRSFVLNKIQENKNKQNKPHVSNNSGNNEWYTPQKYIVLAREVMGDIDLDPASCEYANKTVKALKYFSVDDDGLSKEWHGRVWMNPPYGTETIAKFTEKFVDEWRAGHIVEGIVLVNNATETSWFTMLVKCAKAVAFAQGRIRYESQTRDSLAPLQGQVFIYFGDNAKVFINKFKEIGWCAIIA